MPTLRRSKSLNDKISRQKNRSGDVVRDPRSPDVEGRTRTCVDNFQALVHLRKQTEDKARQLELAYNYATNGHHTFLRRGPSGGVELPYPSTPSTLTSTAKPSSSRHHPDAGLSSTSKPPVPLVPRRQHSAEGRTERSSLLRRQESFSETPSSQQHQSRREQRRGQQRPMSMVEPRAGALFPTPEELTRKEQVIQNLTESQRSLNAHNQKLLSKVDELEFENRRLRDLLSAHNVRFGTYSPPPPPMAGYPGATRAHRSISLHGDALKVSGPHALSGHALVSPHSETSVSGYGSLVDSPSGETGVPDPRVVTRVGEEEDDDTLPLSGVSECSLEYRHDTLEKTSSSASSSSRVSRAATLNSDRSERDSPSGGGKARRAMGQDEEEEEEEEGNPRIEELAKQVAELSSQRDTVLHRYKQLVDDNLRIQKRDRRVGEELGNLLDLYDHQLQDTLKSELQIIQEQLRDFTEDVQVEVQRVLTALDSTSSSGPQTSEGGADLKDPQVRDMLDRLLDLIGPDYQRLGRRLTVPQPELDRLERGGQSTACGPRVQAMLRTWLRRRGGAGPLGAEVPVAVRHLVQALRDVDKDLRHCHQTTVSAPERQALRNCLQAAIDHVTDPRDLLDHLIALNELTPASIAFVQEVLEKRERAVCRLWHVSEYRGTGMVSRLALALDRSHCPQVAHRLRDELEIQNSRIHTRCHSPSLEPLPNPSAMAIATTATTTTPAPTPPASIPSDPPPTESRPSTSQVRSRPISRVPRLRSKTFDSTSPVKPSPATESAIPAASKDRTTPSRQLSQGGAEREGPRPQKERPSPSVLKDRAAPAVREDRTTSGAKVISRQRAQQPERRALPVPRERSFSPSQKDKPASAIPREKSSVHAQKERPLSPLVKDTGDKPDPAAKNDQPVHNHHKDRPFSPFDKDKPARPFSPLEKDKSPRPFSPLEKDKTPRPFSPLEKDKTPRPFSPLEKDKTPRPFSPLEKDKTPRPFSPLEKDKTPRPFSPIGKDRPPRPFSPLESTKAVRSYSPHHKPKAATAATPQHGRSGLQTPRDRPFSPFQKDKAASSSQKERASPSAQKEGGNSPMQKEKPTSAPEETRAVPQPPKDTQAVWDRRASALSNDGAHYGFGARNTVVLEEGGKISRV